jgi:hypothetical protein
MTLYRNILKQALKSTWHNKYLWFFGIFAALLGNGGELELLFRRFDTSIIEKGLFPGIERIIATGFFSKATFFNITNLATRDPLSLFLVLSVLIIILLVVGFLIWLTIVSQAALVNNAARIKVGKRHNFKSALEVGVNKFFGVFGLNIFLKIAIYLAFILLSLPILISVNKAFFSTSSVLFIVSFILFIPLAIIISFITKYAIAYFVIKESRFFESIKLGWQLFIRNWLISIEMAFLLFFINLLVGLGLILMLLVFTVPFLFLVIVLSKIAFYFNFWMIVASALILYTVAIVITGAILATFQISSWTGLFLELISRGGASKLTRVFKKE